MSGQQPSKALQSRFSFPSVRNSQNNITTTQKSRKISNVISNGSSQFLPSTPPPLAVLGKRKLANQTEEMKRSNNKRKSDERNVFNPLHRESVTKNDYCSDELWVNKTKEKADDTTEPFENVLEELGRSHAPLLAQEIKQLNVSRFPMDAMAEKLANKMILDRKTNSDSAIDSSIDIAVIVRSLLRELRESITNPNTEIMEKLELFDTISESFGLKNAVNHLDFLDQCISCLCSKLSKKNEQSPK